jgi:hypothetical protein
MCFAQGRLPGIKGLKTPPAVHKFDLYRKQLQQTPLPKADSITYKRQNKYAQLSAEHENYALHALCKKL